MTTTDGLVANFSASVRLTERCLDIHAFLSIAWKSAIGCRALLNDLKPPMLRDGVEISRSLMAHWMGYLGFELQMLADYVPERVKEGKMVFSDPGRLIRCSGHGGRCSSPEGSSPASEPEVSANRFCGAPQHPPRVRVRAGRALYFPALEYGPCTNWGHTSRLHRDISGSLGTKLYALEELVPPRRVYRLLRITGRAAPEQSRDLSSLHAISSGLEFTGKSKERKA
jgi:hypothetical protein